MTQPICRPKLFTTLRDYSGRQFLRDLVAGLTVGVVALPLAMAFGIASIPASAAAEVGLSPPVIGLFTAIVAGFLISALGGTRTSIGGPTGAFVVIVYAIASQHGYAGLAMATMMAGLILVFLGAIRLGGMIKYIPYPVTTGFTAGIAVVIFAGQIKDLLGMRANGGGDAIPPEFLGKVEWYIAHASTAAWPTAALGVASVAALFLWPRFVTRKIPGPVAVMLLATLAAHLIGLPVETIGDRFGAIPSSLPTPRLPDFDWSRLPSLIGPAFTIAILASIESLLCAVVADGMIGSRHRSNTELVAQGVANLAAPLMGGMPATGAIARTATNIQAGGRTPIAGIVHALTLLGIVLALGKYAALVPLSVLAAVLVVVAYRMAELDRVRWLLVSGPRSDAAVLLLTLALTVLIDLTVAVQAGLVLAALLFIKRMADSSGVETARAIVAQEDDPARDTPLASLSGSARSESHGVEVYDINGPFFFGAAFKLRETIDTVSGSPRVIVLNMARVPSIDATGLHALDDVRRLCKRDGASVVLAGCVPEVRAAILRSGLLDRPGKISLASSVADAMRLLHEPGSATPEPHTRTPAPAGV